MAKCKFIEEGINYASNIVHSNGIVIYANSAGHIVGLNDYYRGM